MDTPDNSTMLIAAADALAAGRAIVGHLGSPLLAPLRQTCDVDLDDLARILDGPAALDASTREDASLLLAALEEEAAAGTVFTTEWMPKSCCGDDVTEWEPWRRSVRSAEAEQLLVVSRDLRRLIDCSNRVDALIAAAGALELALRNIGGRSRR